MEVIPPRLIAQIALLVPQIRLKSNFISTLAKFDYFINCLTTINLPIATTQTTPDMVFLGCSLFSELSTL